MTTATCDISVRFHEPPADMAALFTTFYRVEFHCPDGRVRDALQPEWGGLRFFDGQLPESRIGGGKWLRDADFTAMGPSSQPISFTLGSCSMWGVGFLPLGWATFMQQPASVLADRICDGRSNDAFQHFQPLADELSFDAQSEQQDVALIEGFFREMQVNAPDPDHRIRAIHQMLLDPELPTVASMADRCGMNQRTMERLCRKYFGFPPKLLLRRQRFMRSLTKFMLDPSLGWIGALDSLYFDQSHFVRDCHTFLGMAPSEYAAMDHPILTAFMRERMKAHGSAVQTLDKPA
uniref:AraC family transcriptional regulator n=1 Tax=Parerythrobacter lutipelagi TaxID=1964208 RepID=UPI001EFF9C24|nr:helix-turn-helix domain-containing protein [Parerythrobacter lutipelagi]